MGGGGEGRSFGKRIVRRLDLFADKIFVFARSRAKARNGQAEAGGTIGTAAGVETRNRNRSNKQKKKEGEKNSNGRRKNCFETFPKRESAPRSCIVVLMTGIIRRARGRTHGQVNLASVS